MFQRAINNMTPVEVLMFLKSWLQEPLRVGAIAPSGSVLADIITSEVSASTGHVIELGPGTGAFTARILQRGIQADRLTLVEHGKEFVTHLEKRFPGIRIVNMDAARLRQLTLADDELAGAVISGLPLLGMSTRKVISILDGAFSLLKPDGAFYQFTYSGRSPVSRTILDRLGIRATMIGKTLRNVPPASVYRFSRRQPFRWSARTGTGTAT